LFLNFGFYPRQTFTLVLWSTSLAAFSRSGTDPYSLVGKWVKVTGVIGSYRHRPQMTVELPSQVQILSGEEEARQWLEVTPPASMHFQVRRPISQPDESVLNIIYSGRRATPAPTPPSPTTPTNKFDPSHGIVGGIILGIVAATIWGFWGFVAGAVLGYQIGKRL
jgi:hypothetical protein